MEKTEIQIQSNYFVVLGEEEEEIVSGGIILPKKKKRESIGVIVAAGDNPDDPRLKVGCKVMFNQFGGTKIRYKNKPHYFLKSDDLFGIVETFKPLSKSLSEMKL